MIIQLNQTEVEVKTKSATLQFEKKLVNSIALNGPGEYEVADMSIEVFSNGVIAMTTEGLLVCFIVQPISHKETEVLNALQEVDVAIVKFSEGRLSAADGQKLLQLIEPKITIPVNHGSEQQFCKLIGGCPEPTKQLKITKTQLQTDDQTRVVLLS